jgi:pSer/pThr/pTyr-binding forkhead associated (FHA) protein
MVDSTLPAAAPAGTFVFDGFRTPSIEARISERKHDGSWGSPLQIVGGVSIGRTNCEISFPDDPRLADRHALLSNRQGKLFLEDFGSLSGTFIKQRQDTELVPGDIFLLGQDLFRFTTQSLDEAEKPGATHDTAAWISPPKLQRGPITAKLEHILLTGEVIEEFRLEAPETTLGRTNANLVFKDDHYMSGTHARIVAQPGRFVLQDLRSRNGVFRRVRSEIELEAGDEFFLGEHLFRVEIKPLSQENPAP